MAMTEAALQRPVFGLLGHHLEMKASSQGQAGSPGLVAPRAGVGGVPQAKGVLRAPGPCRVSAGGFSHW